MDAFVKYFVFGITLAISIGPVNIELIKRGVTKGFLASWLVGIGGMAADLIILGIIGLGAGSYLTSDLVQLLFGCLGAVMLLQIGYANTRKGVADRGQPNWDTPASAGERNSFTTGFFLAIANPLNLVFWTGIYSSLLTMNSVSVVDSTAELVAAIFAGIAVSNLLFALMASFGKTYAKPHVLRLISLASGVLLIGYGLWIGYSTVSAKWMLVVHMTAK